MGKMTQRDWELYVALCCRSNSFGPCEPKKKRGFAVMDRAKQREIASMGGTAVSKDRAHMAAIGRIGGQHKKI